MSRQKHSGCRGRRAPNASQEALVVTFDGEARRKMPSRMLLGSGNKRLFDKLVVFLEEIGIVENGGVGTPRNITN